MHITRTTTHYGVLGLIQLALIAIMVTLAALTWLSGLYSAKSLDQILQREAEAIRRFGPPTPLLPEAVMPNPKQGSWSMTPAPFRVMQDGTVVRVRAQSASECQEWEYIYNDWSDFHNIHDYHCWSWGWDDCCERAQRGLIGMGNAGNILNQMGCPGWS